MYLVLPTELWPCKKVYEFRKFVLLHEKCVTALDSRFITGEFVVSCYSVYRAFRRFLLHLTNKYSVRLLVKYKKKFVQHFRTFLKKHSLWITRTRISFPLYICICGDWKLQITEYIIKRDSNVVHRFQSKL